MNGCVRGVLLIASFLLQASTGAKKETAAEAETRALRAQLKDADPDLAALEIQHSLDRQAVEAIRMQHAIQAE